LGQAPAYCDADNKASNGKIDWVEIAFKKAKILSGHATPMERLSLVKLLIEVGHLDEARELLQKGTKIPDQFRIQKLDVELALEAAEYFAILDSGTAKQQIKDKIITLLGKLALEKEIKRKELLGYLRLAEQFNAPGAVIKFSMRLAKLDGKKGAKWWYKSGVWSQGNDQPSYAVYFFDKAHRFENDPVNRQEYRIAWFNALNTAGQNDKLASELERAVTEKNLLLSTIEQLALLSLKVEKPGIAWRLYGRLFNEDRNNRLKWLEETYQWALAANQPCKAAQLLRILQNDTLTNSEKNSCLIKQLHLYRHCGASEKALLIADLLHQRNALSKDLLQIAVQIALIEKNYALAKRWNENLIRMDPSNPERSKVQAEIALAQNEPEKAAEYYRQLHNQHPHDKTIHRKLANLEEWAGRPSIALEHWVLLSRTEKQIEIYETIYRLSSMLNKHSTAIDALKEIAKIRDLTQQQVIDRINLYERIGEPEIAVDHTTDYIKTHPKAHRAVAALARLQMRMQDFHNAAQTWEMVAHADHYRHDIIFSLADCYWRTGKKQNALNVIDRYKDNFDNLKDLAHAYLLLELSWEFRRHDLSKYCFDILIEKYSEDKFYIIERIIYLHEEAGNRKEAVQYAIKAAHETKNPDFLNLALNIASQKADQTQVDLLMTEYENLFSNYSSSASYWTIKAQTEYAHQNFYPAEQYYRRALSQGGDTTRLREGILWSMLSLGELDRLSAQLDEWYPDAINQKALWLVYALSRHQIGQSQRAIKWYRRLISNGDDHYHILLGYADALEATGAGDSALRTRLYVLETLRSEAGSAPKENKALSDTLKSYITLLFRYGDGDQTQYWTKRLTDGPKDQNLDEPWIYETIISSYLRQHKIDHAKTWLAKAHEKGIQTPYWQDVLIAFEDDDIDKVKEINESGKPLTKYQTCVLLSRTGQYRNALKIAEDIITSDPNRLNQYNARTLALSIKNNVPHYLKTGSFLNFSDQLNSQQSSVISTFPMRQIPVNAAFEYYHYDYTSETLAIDDIETSDEISARMIIGSLKKGCSISIGTSLQEDTVGYGSVGLHQNLTKDQHIGLNIAFNTIPKNNSILQLAATQHGLDLLANGKFAGPFYYAINLWGREYQTRTGKDVAQGYGAVAEIGITPISGKFRCQIGLRGNTERHIDRQLPEDLQRFLAPDDTIDNIVAQEASTIQFGARIGRAQIGEPYPSVGSYRYFASAWIGAQLPSNHLSLNLTAGVGFRIIGNDELSIQTHYNQNGDIVAGSDDSGISINYQYNF
jgi:predicted Zn-dependent protease